MAAEEIGRTPTRRLSLLLCFFVVAIVLRATVAYRGGIWADEGFFLSVVGIPTWAGMINFLQFHESHPPLFYVVTRLWIAAFGNSDRVVLMLPVILGASLVPVTYFIGKSLFSSRAGLLA